MQNLLFDELCIKRIKKQFLIFAVACVTLVSVIYTPMYLLLSSNVLWRGSVLLFLLTELVEPLIDFSFYWGSFAFLIYAYLRFGKKQIKDFLIIYAVAVMARYFVTMLVGYILMSFPDAKTFWGEEFLSVLFSIGMDALQMLGVLLLTEFFCRRSWLQGSISSTNSGSEKTIADCFPIEGLFRFQNPLARLCFFSALIPTGLKILSRIYFDIFFWGLPTDAAEWLLLITYYIGDIATLFIGYFVLLYLLQMFHADETKRRVEFEA